MQPNNIHRTFILSPITVVLEKVVDASKCLTGGMEFYTLKDYLFQSMFLQMTGFQEQKLKCICWFLATCDYDYRRTLLNNEDNLGECSSIKAKSSIYKRLIESIKRYDGEITVEGIVPVDAQTSMKESSVEEIKKIFHNTVFETWAPREYHDLESNGGLFAENQFLVSEDVFVESKLSNAYIILYNNRNRFAHNLYSYQENVPTLKSLATESLLNTNFFIWFAVLNLFDKIFTTLYSYLFNLMSSRLV